ncbi:phosphate ABC transporter permease PstA [Psychrobium sp. 1_MG-2023]|uniref:phosphate ABC transporter permease PstA n=1 Tax=Psychrobium sp. 1_MG-2023 TaxID=3062624 RepID=UPI000C33A926|nr:phosphate ABC transporter permease PstA [Psychrobium sp. 1_MG-2023]MDP2560912.1 phosphate ABC transporter permease PstA [Psychrobium sp. 1_MG-2023]PKF55986.1 phosphate ABC transporter, permease protein PstA [Alteromonadales bacterium alter-6D02]
MGQWYKSGSPWIWLTSGAVSLSLIAVIGLLGLIAWRGLVYFWPSTIYQFDVTQPNGITEQVIGEIYERDSIPAQRLRDNGQVIAPDVEEVESILIKTGNREFVELDFRWILADTITKQQAHPDLVIFERNKNGNFYGYIDSVVVDGQLKTGDNATKLAALEQSLARVELLNEQADELQSGNINHINYQLEGLRLEQRRLELENKLTPAVLADIEQQRTELGNEYLVHEKRLFELRAETKRDKVQVRDMRGEIVELSLSSILAVHLPNQMGIFAKIGHWLSAMASFVVDDPREANTEGGVFPAIFGTIFMVLLMAVIVTPFGVVAAIYLHEYAKKGTVTKFIRIAVINLAGVPSVVYGVFGLGFFVYILGGSIDELFYPEASPSPVFGSPGVLWSALTLAILTLPVVIVSTEEGLSRIPISLRQGSLALGATQAETLWKVVIPMASPAIMTGLILAVARAAGEVAPLMLVGVVKMAPALPIDGNFPFIHVERKFMHLGFHIYDVGFQSPNVEAARPLVFASSFLLVTVIIGLNMTAIGIRNYLREKYRSLEH